jgi:fructuronate reductase
MADRALARLVRRHMRAAAATLSPLEGVDFETYAGDLARRFRNPQIAHETFQIAMDGTEKLPQRILAPALDTLRAGGDVAPFAFATAAWMRYALGVADDGTPYALRDPREEEIAARLVGRHRTGEIVDALMALPGLFPQELAQSSAFRAAVLERLTAMREAGMAAAIRREAAADG